MIGIIIEVVTAIAALSGVAGVILSHMQWKEKFELQKQEFELTKASLERDMSRVKQGMIDYKDSINKLVGSLYKVLYRTNADRCYIIQPLPIDDTKFLVVKFEVDDRGISECMKVFGRFDITKYYDLYNSLKNNDFLYYRHTSDISDLNAKRVVLANGADMLAAHQILDNSGKYVGSIICEWMDDHELPLEEIKEHMDSCAGDIQFYLPPVED